MGSNKDIEKAWKKAKPIRGKNPDVWRRDPYGNKIRKGSYGTHGEYGWELDHSHPQSKGGSDKAQNIQPLHWKENRKKVINILIRKRNELPILYIIYIKRSKKVMIKLIITALLLLSLPNVVFAQEPVKVEPPQQKILSSPNGRYVFGQISEFRKDQYLLDTKTGRLWQIVVDKKGIIKLQPVPFIQIWGDEAYIPDPMKEVEGQRKLMLMKRAEDLKKLFGSQSQRSKEKKK